MGGLKEDEFPRHNGSLTLEHNEHRDCYDPLEEWLSETKYDWPSEEAKERAIQTDSLWTLHWYPDTPIGFHSIAAPTLRELLDFAAQVEGEQ